MFVAGVASGCGAGAGSGTATETVTSPAPAPAVSLSAEDQKLWAPGATPPGIPALLYHGIGTGAGAEPADAAYTIAAGDFAKQMALLHHAGYHTVTLEQFEAYVAGRAVHLPSRPLLITFDDGLASSWVEGDGALQREGFSAVMFVDGGRVNQHASGYLHWAELRAMRAGGRWDIQLHAWKGHQYIHYGSGPNEYGAFYAYRQRGEKLEGWRMRVFGDIDAGRAVLSREVPNDPALAFAPPYGNYGQEGTNDPKIPGALLSWLRGRYRIVFVQNRHLASTPHESQPLGRFQVSHSTTGGELHAQLVEPPR
jgi:peptidoglycan/xylan/chitin deacetylase (PgdA/CDA1 family)